MAVKKEITGQVKLQIIAGKANPAPPVGPALAQHGVNIMDFCRAFNEKTKGQEEMLIPVLITVYKDKSYSFILKSPPASALIKKACGIEKGSAEPHKNKVAKLPLKKVEEIAKMKMNDMNAISLEAACKSIAGTARSMGIDVV